MEKTRPIILIIAIFFTFWYLKSITPPVQQPKTKQASSNTVTQNKSTDNINIPNTITSANQPIVAHPKPSNIKIVDDIILKNDVVKIILTNNGAVVKSVELQKYFEDTKNTQPLLLLSDQYGRASFGVRLHNNAQLQPWKVAKSSTNSVTFIRPDNSGLILTKTFTLTDSGDLHTNTSITNPTNNTIAIAPYLDGPAGIKVAPHSLLGASSKPFVYGVYDDNNIDLKDEDLKDIKEDGYTASVNSSLRWFSLRSKYFVAASMVENAKLYHQIIGSYIKNPTDDKSKESLATTLVANMTNLAPQQTKQYKFNTYLGPISRQLFATKPYTDLEPLAHLGRLAPICGVLIGIINIFHSIIGNYGLAILLVTLLVKLALHPLTAKGMRSMYAMQKIGPKLKALKEKYGDDRQKFGMEQMKLFKQEEVNPMMGCLPMLLQMPVYIALYTTLTRVIEVRHASFLWIDDLSKSDALFAFGTTIPILGDTFNLLPLLWMTSMFFQQKMTPKSPDPNMAQQQKMMQFIPFVFGFMMYSMPSGLMLYWVAQNIFSIIEQAKIRKKYMPKTT